MTQDKRAIDVGGEIAGILAAWRPQEGAHEDIADAVMAALGVYNMKVAPTMESELRTIFELLEDRFNERRRSF